MFKYKIEPYILEFIKPAITSRNAFTERKIFLIHLEDSHGSKGVGEASPLSLLSIDDTEDYEQILETKLQEFCEVGNLNLIDLEDYPSIKFGMETALLDLGSTTGNLFNTPFTRGEQVIPINGLVWMGDAETMLLEAFNKIKAGYDVIKIKVGALDFDSECRILESIRKKYSAFKITLRLDANGGFSDSDATEQLKELSRFEIHSIEQPVKPGNWDVMAKLCSEAKIDIALDEEIIGIHPGHQGDEVLKAIKPRYIILKPNLVGGLNAADQWIRAAQKHNVEWWATSALESNIGLNAIAQWVSTYNTSLHQGLGTGALFKNNFESKLSLSKGLMSYKV